MTIHARRCSGRRACSALHTLDLAESLGLRGCLRHERVRPPDTRDRAPVARPPGPVNPVMWSDAQCLTLSVMSCWPGCGIGVWIRSSGFPGTASMVCSPPGSVPTTSRSSCRPGTRRWRRSRRSGSPSSPAKSESASRPAGPARSICSTACMTPSSTTCRWSPSWARPSARRWAARTSRKWTCSACSRTSAATTCRCARCPSSCPTSSTGRSGSRSARAPRPASSSPPT